MKAEHHLVVRRSAIEAEELAGLRLFASADMNLVTDLLQDCPLLTLRQDEVLLVPGMVNRNLYLLLRGRLRVHLESLDTEAVHHVEAGETVGEISAIDEKPTSAHVVADTTATVLAIDQSTFWSLVNASHAIARNMLLMVVERMRANNDKVAAGVRTAQRHQTNVDELTGLRNARALVDLLRRQMLRSSMGRKPVTVLMVDIDNFTRFNSDFGADAGDQAIHALAQTLQEQLRPTDIAARVTGEKFAVILPECDTAGARVVAARLRDAVAETVIVMSDESILPPVTISLGIAEARPFEQAEDVLSAAEQALMRAKVGGRNTYSN
jgi:diguanylate cyclase (GGDEF)-like protein